MSEMEDQTRRDLKLEEKLLFIFNPYHYIFNEKKASWRWIDEEREKQEEKRAVLEEFLAKLSPQRSPALKIVDIVKHLAPGHK